MVSNSSSIIVLIILIEWSLEIDISLNDESDQNGVTLNLGERQSCLKRD